jgi:hypothetical protein
MLHNKAIHPKCFDLYGIKAFCSFVELDFITRPDIQRWCILAAAPQVNATPLRATHAFLVTSLNSSIDHKIPKAIHNTGQLVNLYTFQ